MLIKVSLLFLIIQYGFLKAAGQASCDVLVKDTNPKIIFTPNYPDDYGSYSNCKYIFERANQNVCKVELEIVDFSLEEDNGCNNDYFDLGPNYGATGSTSRKLCGNIIASTKKELYFTNTNTLTTAFRSDGTGSARGFSIKVKQVPNSCSGIDTRTDRPPTGGGACFYRLQGEFVTLTSQNYPRQYSPNLNCIYEIQRLDQNVCTVKINVNIFNLDGNPGQCYGDYLELPSGEKLCGQQSTTRTITVQRGAGDFNFKFHTNGFDERTGFRISVQQVRNSCFGGNPFTTTQRPGGACRVELRGISGTITSPGFPSHYPTQVQCTYIIRRYDSNVCSVELDVQTFDLAGSIGCLNEYFQLNTGERLCGKVSGKKTIVFDKNQNFMTLTFVSSAQARFHKGFQIRITQKINSCAGVTPNPPTSGGFCNQVITGSTSQITSPGYASGQYSNNLRCIYTIKRQDSSTCLVDVNFSIAGIEDSYSCFKDAIRLPNGLSLCGRNKFIQRQLAFPSGNQDTIQIAFVTDGYGTERGFEMTVQQKQGSCSGSIFPTSTIYPGITYPSPSPGTCGGSYSTETFYLKSPGFQLGNYQNNQNCEYRINKVSNSVCALQLTFTKFDLEKSEDCTKDYLEVDEIKSCGVLDYDSVRTYRFTRDTEIIRFHSDLDKTAAGFFISGKQLKC